MSDAPRYSDDVVTLYQGDARETLSGLEAGSADCIVTSPPYYGLRDYGVEGQYGLEESPVHNRLGEVGTHPAGRNPGDVWEIATAPFAAAHFACMPPVLAERCVRAGCKPGGTVLDPFSGSGTTGLAATKLGRRYVGIDLNGDYLDLSLRTRLAQTALCDAPQVEVITGEATA